jgi:hypothetical protein
MLTYNDKTMIHVPVCSYRNMCSDLNYPLTALAQCVGEYIMAQQAPQYDDHELIASGSLCNVAWCCQYHYPKGSSHHLSVTLYELVENHADFGLAKLLLDDYATRFNLLNVQRLKLYRTCLSRLVGHIVIDWSLEPLCRGAKISDLRDSTDRVVRGDKPDYDSRGLPHPNIPWRMRRARQQEIEEERKSEVRHV